MPFIKKHWAAGALAIIVGSIIIAPSFYFRHMSGEYQGVDLFHSDAELNYVAQIQEVYDGHYSLGNIYLKDGKDLPAGIQRPLSALFVAGLGKLFGLSAVGINLYSKFILPAALTLIIYSFLARLTGKRGIALAGTAFIMFNAATLSFYFFPFGWWRMFVQGIFTNVDYQFLAHGRSINPQVSSLFFYGYLLLLYRALYSVKQSEKRVCAFGAAVIFGLSFYTYFFAFSFLSVFSVVLFIVYALKRDREKVKQFVYIGGGAFLIALPSLITFYQATQLPFYAEATERVGAYLGRAFIFSKLWWGAALVFALLYRKIMNERIKYFVLAFLLSGFILTNQQLITGRMIPAPQHYHWYYLAPMFGVWGIILAGTLISRYAPRWHAAFVIASLGLFAWAGVLFQWRSYQNYHPMILEEGRYGHVLSWINAAVPKDASVLSNMTMAPLTVSFTHANTYYHRGITDFPISRERLKHALFVYIFLDGATAGGAERYFLDNRNLIGSWLYGEYYRQQFGCNGCFSDEHLRELVREYQIFTTKNFITELRRYPLDYIVWDKEKDPAWGLDRFFGDPVYEDAGIFVYQVSS